VVWLSTHELPMRVELVECLALCLVARALNAPPRMTEAEGGCRRGNHWDTRILRNTEPARQTHLSATRVGIVQGILRRRGGQSFVWRFASRLLPQSIPRYAASLAGTDELGRLACY
jgi:hypothetical protein